MVYLLHFDPPFGHARHAWVDVTSGRELLPGTEFDAGRVDVALLNAAAASGTSFVVARAFPGGLDRARQMRKRGGGSRECPICVAGSRARAVAPGTDRTGGGRGEQDAFDPINVRRQRRKLSRQGNSLMVAVPQDVLLNLHILPGDELIVVFDPQWGGFFVRPERPRAMRPIDDAHMRDVVEAAR